PATPGMTAIVTVAESPTPRSPSAAFTTPPACEADPREETTLTTVAPPGRISFNATPVAVDGPRFVTAAVRVRTLPVVTLAWSAESVTERSADGTTLVARSDVLFERSPSVSFPLTEAALNHWPGLPGAVTTIVRDTLAPDARGPMLSTSLPPAADRAFPRLS